MVMYTLGKEVLRYTTAYNLVFMRLLLVVPFIFLIALAVTRNLREFKVTKKQMLPTAGSGVLGIVVGQILIFTGLNYSTPTNSSIITAPCTPIFTALFSILRGTDKMNVYKAIGFIFSLSGALILLEVENFQFEGTTLGNLLIMLSSVVSAINALLQKSALDKGAHPLVVQFYVCVIGTLAISVAYSPFGIYSPGAYQMPSLIWIYVIVLGVGVSAIPWSLTIIALKNTSPMTINIYVVLQPPMAAFVDTVILGGTLSARQLLGSSLVLLGLFFVNASSIVQKGLEFIRHHIFGNSKPHFQLLPNVEEGLEMKELNQTNKANDKTDVYSSKIEDLVPEETTTSTEVEYQLSINRETNDFVIQPMVEEKLAKDANKVADTTRTEEKDGADDLQDVSLLSQPPYPSDIPTIKYKEHQSA